MRGPAYDIRAANRQIARDKADQLRAEIRRDLEVADAYAARHGSFAEMVRQHYLDSND